MKDGWLPGLIPSGHPSELEGHTANGPIQPVERMSAEEDPPWDTVGHYRLDNTPLNAILQRYRTG